MIYSKFYGKWIATCMRCNLGLVNFNATANLLEIPNDYYDFDILKKYFIIDGDMLEVRSSCGRCCNKKCKAYFKNQ